MKYHTSMGNLKKMKILALVIVLFCEVSTALNIVDVATNIGATTFVKYLNSTGLLPAFTQNGKFTVFIPTNDAFDALPSNVKAQLTTETDLLRQVMMYHATDNTKYSSQLTNDMVISSLVMDANIRINIYSIPKPMVTASGCEVIQTDLNATNGVIHVISRVMFPLPLSDAVQFLASNADLGTLLYSVAMTPLRSLLQEPGPFTIFAPNNEAFNKLQPGYWSNLLNQNYTAYVDMLKYHVVPGTIYSQGLMNGPLITMTGQKIHIHPSQATLMVNNATVVTSDQSIKNGVIHIIDTVLIPV